MNLVTFLSNRTFELMEQYHHDKISSQGSKVTVIKSVQEEPDSATFYLCILFGQYERN